MPRITAESPAAIMSLHLMRDDLWVNRGMGYWTKEGVELKDAGPNWISTRVLSVLIAAGKV